MQELIQPFMQEDRGIVENVDSTIRTCGWIKWRLCCVIKRSYLGRKNNFIKLHFNKIEEAEMRMLRCICLGLLWVG